MDIRIGQSVARPELTTRTQEHEADSCPLDCGVRPKIIADYTARASQFRQYEST